MTTEELLDELQRTRERAERAEKEAANARRDAEYWHAQYAVEARRASSATPRTATQAEIRQQRALDGIVAERNEARAALDKMCAEIATAEKPVDKVRALALGIKSRDKRIKNQRDQLRAAHEDAVRRKLDLDALQTLWCWPGRVEGQSALTREMVETAIKRVEGMARELLKLDWTCKLPTLDARVRESYEVAQRDYFRLSQLNNITSDLHVEAVQVATDAMRCGLEECERLRAECERLKADAKCR